MVPAPRTCCDTGQCAMEVPVWDIRSNSASWRCTACAIERDLAVVVDEGRTVGDRHQRVRRFGKQRRAGEVKNVPKVNPSHAFFP